MQINFKNNKYLKMYWMKQKFLIRMSKCNLYDNDNDLEINENKIMHIKVRNHLF